MNRIIILLFACLPALNYAQDMRSVFSKMPDKLLILADSIQRQDLMDTYNFNHKAASLKNNLNDTVWLNDFSDNHLLIRINHTTTEIILLPMINDSKVVCVIHTVCAPVCDSRISFYTVDWKQLETGVFFTPAPVSAFLREDVNRSDMQFIEAMQALDIDLMQLSFDKEKLTIAQTYNTPLYVDKEHAEKIKPYLKGKPIIFSWTKTQFQQ